ncbi:MAG: hypothetical protein KAY65_09855 [Planctomycetes bacterium]|nr:hypothetical protein [Planctomycetota bacterium]
MSKRIGNILTTCFVAGLIIAVNNVAQANWSETFGGNDFDLTWTFGCYPAVTGTFTHLIKDGPGDDDYLGLDESTPFDLGGGSYGSAFGMGFCAEDFSDVRVGAVVNVMGDASRNYSGIAARGNWFIDPDGQMTGAPGMVAIGAYTLFYHWEDGPRRVRIEIMKIFMNDDAIMGTYMPEVPVPGLDHVRSRYVELDVVGSDPVYVTGSIYEYKGGPLLVRTPTMVDTGGRDPWENSDIPDGWPVLAGGKSGVFATNENPTPVGYHVTFDTVSSVSDGPSAVCLSPADGATGVDVDADLSWVEAAFATSRELWFGKAGAMKKITPAGTTYDPGTLEFGQTYQWQVSPVEGYVYTFTTAGTPDGCLSVDDFESYSDDGTLQAAWPDNIDGYNYTFLETSEDLVYAGSKAMRYECQNQFTPYLTKATRTFAAAQDWARGNLAALSLFFRGEDDNLEQRLYVELEDATGPASAVAVDNPYSYAIRTEMWQKWTIELSKFSDGGLDLSQVKKITIGLGDGTNSGQADEDKDTIYIDEIRVCPPRCSLDSRADIDGNCRIDFGDFAVIAAGWLSEGEYELP